MSELKPCPFCNGSQEATQDISGKWRGSHECDFVDPSAWFDTYEDFIEAWNARCERTCKMFVSPECEQQWADSTAYYCSACGHGNLDPIVGGYCRYCGARVVTA